MSLPEPLFEPTAEERLQKDAARQRVLINPNREDGAIVLKYKPRSTRALIFVLSAFVPLWGVWLPWAMFSGVSPNSETSFALMVCGTVVLSAVAAAFAVLLDTKVSIDSVGISLPARFLLASGFRRKLYWKELESVIYRPAEDELSSEIVLQFADAKLPFSIGALTKEDLRRLVFSAQTNCDAGVADASLQIPTFTAIWEEEMSARFSPTAFVPLPPGSMLNEGKIEIIGQSACGGLSAVYIGKLADGRKVIVKEAVTSSNAEPALQQKALELFSREAELLQNLEHPRISKVLDHFAQKSRQYIVLEHLQGVDLRRFIRDNGRQHEEIVLRWAIEIADVLEYLHNQNPPILHRDLTPDNLIFTADGEIAVIDFGAASAYVAEATGTLVGKQNYIAPEQFKGKATPQSDIYALGCTMHYLLTGLDPEPLNVSHPAEFNREVSDATDRLVAACTALEPEDRIETAVTLASKLRGILNTRRSAASKAGM